MSEANEPIVYSAYWSNIDASILRGQANVFKKLDIELRQVNTSGEHHGAWMTRMVDEVEGDIVFFCDIDAFPISRKPYEDAVSVARKGGIFGLAQVANHIDPNMIYAGPMFLAFSKETYRRVGRPSLCHSNKYDPAQLLTAKAVESGVSISMLYPSAVIIPKWALSNIGVFGVGTFYGKNEVFHLFHARKQRYIGLFRAVSEDVFKGKLNFSHYLELANETVNFRSDNQGHFCGA